MAEFTSVEFDLENIPLDAEEGTYTATCTAKCQPTKDEHFPMFILEWKLTEREGGGDVADDARVTDFLVLFPAGHKASKIALRRVASCLKACGIPLSVFPKKVEGVEDLKPVLEALNDAEATIKVKHGKDRNGEPTLRVSY